MPRETDGTWGRYEGTPSRTVPASEKVQGKNSKLAFRRDRRDSKYGEVGISTYDVRAGQAEAATYQGRG